MILQKFIESFPLKINAKDFVCTTDLNSIFMVVQFSEQIART